MPTAEVLEELYLLFVLGAGACLFVFFLGVALMSR